MPWEHCQTVCIIETAAESWLDSKVPLTGLSVWSQTQPQAPLPCQTLLPKVGGDSQNGLAKELSREKWEKFKIRPRTLRGKINVGKPKHNSSSLFNLGFFFKCLELTFQRHIYLGYSGRCLQCSPQCHSPWTEHKQNQPPHRNCWLIYC